MEREVNFYQRLFAGNIKLDGDVIIGDPCYFDRNDDVINNIIKSNQVGPRLSFMRSIMARQEV